MADDMVEISKSELEALKRSYDLLDKIWPKMEVKRLAKEAMPELKIPEIDLVEQATAPINEKFTALEAENKKLREDIDTDRKTREEEKQMQGLQARLEKARKQFGLTDEGLQKVVDRMKEQNNPDVESAAAFIVSQAPKPEPVTPSGLAPEEFNLFGIQEKDDSYAKLHENPTKWFDSEVRKILAETPAEAA